ncbi:hypothetical protein V5O48_007479 [Marasmius crinis-equi]|uniref:AB hydrolase-1 domain-containing protein n=1 Tax=Marasmius crinis-equi TaxID=585013 RepID=A0ABR3FGL7_9AGAR
MEVPFFKEKGYGLIVPDTLGYGGSAKPLDPTLYKMDGIARDIIDIMDAEKIAQAIIIGHDWGSAFASRIVQVFPERVLAFAVLAIGYQVLDSQFDFDKILKFTKEKLGYEIYGYWKFLDEEDSAKLCEDNEKRIQSEELLKGGLAAPTCYYKAILRYAKELGQGTTAEECKTNKPAFIGAASEDYIGVAALNIQQTKAYCENLTVREFQANHWVQLQRPNELNKELEAWLEGL